MRIKTFIGRSIEELLPQIREALGPDAVILSQRSKISGGVAGFFGTKMIEVTASDQMPSDSTLIAMDEKVAAGADLVGVGAREDRNSGSGSDLSDRFRSAMQMGQRGGINAVDDWDPAQDEELAEEYGRVLKSATENKEFSSLDVPVIKQETPQQEKLQTYAPPAALPATEPTPVTSFQASVVDSSTQIPTGETLSESISAEQVNEALQNDLLAPRKQDIENSVSSALDLIDLKALAALRMSVANVVDDVKDDWNTEASSELSAVLKQLAESGVDDSVTASIALTVLKHRKPFNKDVSDVQLVKDTLTEILDIRSGFSSVQGRAYRLAVVGASSTGKTTSAAKIAQGYISTGMRVAVVVVLPNDPTAAVMQDPRLMSLGADVRYVTTVAQAEVASGLFSDYDLVIIDTPSETYLNAGVFAHVSACLSALCVDDVHIVMPLTTSSRDAANLVDTFAPLGANRMIVSKLDESCYIGQLINLCFRIGLPITFMSDGPRVPEDICAASASKIIEKILDQKF